VGLPLDVRSVVEIRQDNGDTTRLWMGEEHARLVRAFLGRWIGST
jgi:hypothetical protein